MTDVISGATLLGKSLFYALPIYAALLIGSRVMCGSDTLKQNYFFIKELIFLTYILALGMITGILDLSLWIAGSNSFSYNLIPFADTTLRQVCLNFILFVPMGILLPMVIKRMDDWRRELFCGFMISLCIEVIQTVFIGRLGDLDDVITNTLGCIAGYGMKKIADGFFTKYAKAEIGLGTLSMVFSAAAFLWGAVYGGLSIGEVVFYQLGIGFPRGMFRYSELISIALAFAALLIGRRYDKDFLAKSGQIFALVNLGLGMVNLFLYPQPLAFLDQGGVIHTQSLCCFAL